MAALSPGNTGIPVGDVRGYEGMGRTSDECVGSFSINVAERTEFASKPAHKVLIDAKYSAIANFEVWKQSVHHPGSCRRRPRLRGYGRISDECGGLSRGVPDPPHPLTGTSLQITGKRHQGSIARTAARGPDGVEHDFQVFRPWRGGAGVHRPDGHGVLVTDFPLRERQ